MVDYVANINLIGWCIAFCNNNHLIAYVIHIATIVYRSRNWTACI